MQMTFLVGVLWQKLKGRPSLHLLWLSVLAVVLGAFAFAITQKVSVFTGFYWAVTTAATVGYGDVTPHNAVGRIVAMGVMLTAIPLLGAVFATWSAALASARVRRLLGMDHHAELKNHLAIYGYNATVAHMLGDLAEGDQPVLLVADVDPATIPARVHLYAGDPTKTEVVEQSRPDRASRALLAGETDAAVLMTAVLVNHYAPQLPRTALVQSPKVAAALEDLGVEHCIATDDLVGHALAKSLETPHAADLLLGIIGNERYQLREKPVNNDWVGRTLSQVRQTYQGVLLGLLHEKRVVMGVEQDPIVQADDRVFVLEAEQ
jgi:voltage-gated potassium channel